MMVAGRLDMRRPLQRERHCNCGILRPITSASRKPASSGMTAAATRHGPSPLSDPWHRLFLTL